METTILPTAVEEYLRTNRAALFDRTERLLAVDTQNPPGATDAVVEQLAAELDAAGVETSTVTVDPQKPNLVATVPGAADWTFCFNGHLDTVPFDETDWSRSPRGERSEDRIYGRGATDMKGAVAAMTQVALAHAATGTTPPGTLQFIFVSDEETGGDAGLATVLERGVTPDACVVGETTARNGRVSVSVADRGRLFLTIAATGTAAHGSRPMIGENAIDKLYAAVEQLRSAFGQQRLTVDGAMDPIIDESVAFYEPETGADPARMLYRYPTINLGTIEGGTAVNTVPASASAQVDIRVTAGVDTEAILGAIRGCLEGMTGIELTDISWTRGTYEPLETPIVEASTRAAERVVDERVYRRSATGGGDAKLFRHDGVPTVEFGFGTQTAHGTNEYTTTQALVRNATAYSAVPYEYEARADQ